MKETISIAAVFMALDMVCLLLWIISGQTPIDSFYAGTVTAHLLGLFF